MHPNLQDFTQKSSQKKELSKKVKKNEEMC